MSFKVLQKKRQLETENKTFFFFPSNFSLSWHIFKSPKAIFYSSCHVFHALQLFKIDTFALLKVLSDIMQNNSNFRHI